MSISIISLIEKDRTTYADLLDYFKDFKDWQVLATHLFPSNSAILIERIRATHNGNIRECKKAMFTEFLKTGDRSWNTVIAALLKTGNDSLVKEIKQKLGIYDSKKF